MSRPRVLLINPPMFIFEPDYPLYGTLGRIHQRTIHPGLVSIASFLRRQGIEAKICDLTEGDLHGELSAQLSSFQPEIVGISSTSAFDYLETLEIAHRIKEWRDNTTVIVGGQQVGSVSSLVLEQSAAVDLVAVAEGEWVMLELARRLYRKLPLSNIDGTAFRTDSGIRLAQRRAPLLSFDEIGPADPCLFPNAQNFIPVIEDSRGCPGTCLFCMNTHMYRSRQRFKAAQMIEMEIAQIEKTWGISARLVGLVSSDFGADRQHTLSVSQAFQQSKLQFAAAIRLENPFEDFLPHCSQSGLAIVHTGLESTVPSILRRMGKTKAGEEYVRRFHKLASATKEHLPIQLRLSMMASLGATPEDLEQDLAFLRNMQDYIDAVGYAVLQIHQGSPFMKSFKKHQAETGCSLITSPYAGATHFYPCHPSSLLSFEQAAAFCDRAERLLNSPLQYAVGRKSAASKEDTKKNTSAKL